MVGEVFIFWSKSHVSLASLTHFETTSSPGTHPKKTLSVAELQARGAELCGDQRDQQHVVPHGGQQEQDEQGELRRDRAAAAAADLV